MAIINENLKNVSVNYKKETIISKYLVPDFYPKKKDIYYKIDRHWYNYNKKNIICSSTNLFNNIIYSTNSRTLVYFEHSSKDTINTISQKINKQLNLTNFK